MSDYIEREAAEELISQPITMSLCLTREECLAKRSQRDIDAAILHSIPAADVRSVVRGKWILYKDRDSTGKFEYVQWSCSACKSNVRTGQPRFDRTLRERPRFNYCPNCGAKMEES